MKPSSAELSIIASLQRTLMERDEEIARLRLERTTATREKGGSKRGGKLNIRLPEQPNVDHELESSPLGEVLLPYEEGQARKPGRQR